METIFAEATAPGRAGVSVIRVSGAHADRVFTVFECAPVKPRQFGVRRLKRGGDLIDRALILCFPEGQSFTGEQVIELHVHGSVAVVRSVLSHLSAVAGFRPALAGEFTRRALSNGRLDITQVEALSDLLVAETDLQRRQASRVAEGALAERVNSWRRELLKVLGQIEAEIDFADEDLGGSSRESWGPSLSHLARDFRRVGRGVTEAERVRQGFEVVFVGAPNTGKSTLLNRLAGREAAITSEHAGTTRDAIEVRFDLQGLPVTFVDLAGMRETNDPIERIGVERALVRAEHADMRWLFGARPEGLTHHAEDILLWPLADLGVGGPGLAISGMTGKGLDSVLEMTFTRLAGRVPSNPIAIKERHRVALVEGAEAIEELLMHLEEDAEEEILAETLRRGIQALDALVGRVGVEDVLGEVFANFCIGK